MRVISRDVLIEIRFKLIYYCVRVGNMLWSAQYHSLETYKVFALYEVDKHLRIKRCWQKGHRSWRPWKSELLRLLTGDKVYKVFELLPLHDLRQPMHPNVTIVTKIFTHKFLRFFCLPDCQQMAEISTLHLFQHRLTICVIDEEERLFVPLPNIQSLYFVFNRSHAHFKNGLWVEDVEVVVVSRVRSHVVV